MLNLKILWTPFSFPWTDMEGQTKSICLITVGLNRIYPYFLKSVLPNYTVDTKLQLKLLIKIQKNIIWFHLTVNTAYFIISPETRQVKTFPKRKREFSWYSEFVNILVIYLQYEMQCQHLLLYSFLILFEHLQIWNNFKKNSVCDYRFIGIWKLYFERIY